jgi:hypothetical protein
VAIQRRYETKVMKDREKEDALNKKRRIVK